MRTVVPAAILLLSACSIAPAQPRYDPACVAGELPSGVAYPAPSDPLAVLFPRPELQGYPRDGDSPSRIVTVRRTGSSEPEVQASIMELADGRLTAELLRPEGCSVEDQLVRAFLDNPRSTESERLAGVRILRTVATEKALPELRPLYREFERLRLSPNLFEGLVLDPRLYELRVEVPMGGLQLSTVTPDKSLAAWADRLIALLMGQPAELVSPKSSPRVTR